MWRLRNAVLVTLRHKSHLDEDSRHSPVPPRSGGFLRPFLTGSSLPVVTAVWELSGSVPMPSLGNYIPWPALTCLGTLPQPDPNSPRRHCILWQDANHGWVGSGWGRGGKSRDTAELWALLLAHRDIWGSSSSSDQAQKLSVISGFLTWPQVTSCQIC